MPAGRFAPSPTAPLHLGNLRTALVSWLFARADGGRFLVRIEDLDRAASREEHVRAHLRDLERVGLTWDGEVVRQSARFDAHREAIAELSSQGRVYPCYCTRREILEAAAAPHDHLPDGAYPGTCRELTRADRKEREAEGRPPALRVRADAVIVGFDDEISGRYEGLVDDFVVQRNDGVPAYNLAVVVDDAAQQVEQVVRGDDLLAGTPRQVLLAQWLGLPVPSYAHVALVCGPDGKRLAKRHGAITLGQLEANGCSAERVCSMLAESLDLAEPNELVTVATMLERFSPERLPRRPWIVPALDPAP